MKLEGDFNNAAYAHVMERLHSEGFTAYAVGGCVRDSLLGLVPADVDVATSARPHDLPKVFGAQQYLGDDATHVGENGVKLYPTGVRHGTWTVRVGEDEVEVTTFRRDVETDGRNATVEYAATYEEDASRRDFTMNALYLDKDNNVLDPTGQGLMDLRNRHVRFVGDANERVREDYLRILRLFRFHARFGKGPMNVDAWNAASAHKIQIRHKVSGERIWEEMKKLLSVHDPYEAAVEMYATGVGPELFSRFDPSDLANLLVHERFANAAPRWTRRYVALVRADLPYPCSNGERRDVEALTEAVDGPMVVSQAVMAHKFGDETAYDWVLFRGGRPNHAELTRGAEAVMPVNGQDLMDRGMRPGKELGERLRAAKVLWERSDLTDTREELLYKVEHMIFK